MCTGEEVRLSTPEEPHPAWKNRESDTRRMKFPPQGLSRSGKFADITELPLAFVLGLYLAQSHTLLIFQEITSCTGIFPSPAS